MRSSQQFVQSVLDGLTSQVCVLDEAGLVVAVNRAWRGFAAANGGACDRTWVGDDYLGACERSQDLRATRPEARSSRCPAARGPGREAAAVRARIRLPLAVGAALVHGPGGVHRRQRPAAHRGRARRRHGAEAGAGQAAPERGADARPGSLDPRRGVPARPARERRWRAVYVSPGVAALFETAAATVVLGQGAPWARSCPRTRRPMSLPCSGPLSAAAPGSTIPDPRRRRASEVDPCPRQPQAGRRRRGDLDRRADRHLETQAHRGRAQGARGDLPQPVRDGASGRRLPRSPRGHHLGESGGATHPGAHARAGAGHADRRLAMAGDPRGRQRSARRDVPIGRGAAHGAGRARRRARCRGAGAGAGLVAPERQPDPA